MVGKEDSPQQATRHFKEKFTLLSQEVSKVIVGYENIIEDVLITFFAQGHVLLEGVPGLGKTMLVKTLSTILELPASRIQFTPDLMPADIIGTNLITENEAGQRAFQFQAGPIFANIVLTDEINRATPKTQSALLECMQEGAITVGGVTHELDRPFFVLATQNPLEMEGTYPLPEAQLDRFFFKILVPFPKRENLNEILRRTTEKIEIPVTKIVEKPEILEMIRCVQEVYVDPLIQDYASRLVLATHPESEYAVEKTRRFVRYGSSPRGAQALVRAAKVRALIAQRYNVSAEDIAKSAKPALRHRTIMNFEGEAEGVTADSVIEAILQEVKIDEPIEI